MPSDCLVLPETSDPRVEIVVHLRLQGTPWGDVARALKITPRAVWDLRDKHNLDAVVDAHKAELHRLRMNKLVGLGDEATDVVAGIMRDVEVAPGVRLAAADKLVAWGSGPPVIAVVPVPMQQQAKRATEELEAIVVSSTPAKPRRGGGSKS